MQNTTYENVFDDISRNHLYVDEIMSTYHAGIFKGSQGKFNDGTLTREQMATVLVNAFNLEEQNNDIQINLANVTPSHKENVKIIAENKMTNQLDNFRPAEDVTRGQFSAFLYRAMQLENDKMLVNEDGISVKLKGIEKTTNADFEQDHYDVNLKIKNGTNNTIIVQSEEFSADGVMVQDMIFFSETVSAGKTANAELTIADYVNHNLPDIKNNMEFTLVIIDKNTFERIGEHEVKINV